MSSAASRIRSRGARPSPLYIPAPAAARVPSPPKTKRVPCGVLQAVQPIQMQHASGVATSYSTSVPCAVYISLFYLILVFSR